MNPVASVVYKYGPLTHGANAVKMPQGAKILHVAFQGDLLRVWALVDQHEAHESTRALHVVGTGEPLPNGPTTGPLSYVGTVHHPEAAAYAPLGTVWHVFEEALRAD